MNLRSVSGITNSLNSRSVRLGSVRTDVLRTSGPNIHTLGNTTHTRQQSGPVVFGSARTELPKSFGQDRNNTVIYPQKLLYLPTSNSVTFPG